MSIDQQIRDIESSLEVLYELKRQNGNRGFDAPIEAAKRKLAALRAHQARSESSNGG